MFVEYIVAFLCYECVEHYFWIGIRRKNPSYARDLLLNNEYREYISSASALVHSTIAIVLGIWAQSNRFPSETLAFYVHDFMQGIPQGMPLCTTTTTVRLPGLGLIASCMHNNDCAKFLPFFTMAELGNLIKSIYILLRGTRRTRRTEKMSPHFQLLINGLKVLYVWHAIISYILFFVFYTSLSFFRFHEQVLLMLYILCSVVSLETFMCFEKRVIQHQHFMNEHNC